MFTPSKGHAQSYCKEHKRNVIHWNASDNPIKGEETGEIK